MKFDFILKNFILQRKKIYTLELIVTLKFSLLCHNICFQSLFPSFFKADLHSTTVSRVTDAIYWHMAFFNLHLRQTKCSIHLTNLFCLLTISSH